MIMEDVIDIESLSNNATLLNAQFSPSGIPLRK